MRDKDEIQTRSKVGLLGKGMWWKSYGDGKEERLTSWRLKYLTDLLKLLTWF